MDLFKVIQSIEDLLYQVATWIFLVPKTLIKVIISPSWAHQYVLEEFEKESSEQFEEYISPIIFLIVGAVLPVFIISALDQESSKIAIYKLLAPKIENKFYIHAFMWAIGPLSFSYVHLREHKKPITRKTIKPFFYSQCFIITPIALLMCIQSGLMKLIEVKPIFESDYFNQSSILVLYIGMFYVWIFYSQIIVFRQDLNISRFKAFGLVWKAMFIAMALYYPILFSSFNYGGAQ